MESVLSFLLATLAFSSVNTLNSPGGFEPNAYIIRIDASGFKTSDKFIGNMEMLMMVKNDINSIVLDTDHSINVTKVTVQTLSWRGEWTPEPMTGYTKDNSTISINFPETLEKTRHIVNVEYTGSYQTSMGGFTKLNIGDSYVGVASLAPTFAHKVWPCYDDPQFRVNITMEIIVPNTHEVVMSILPNQTLDINETSKIYQFIYDQRSYQLALHQLGWFVVDKEKWTAQELNTTTAGKVKITTRALYPVIKHTQWGTDIMGQMVGIMENITGQPLAPENLEQIVLPGVPDDSYHSWGLISYSEEGFLVTPNQTSTRDKQKVALGLAGGVTAQYFGGLISTDSWSNNWLLVGLAEMFMYKISNSVPALSDWKLSKQIVVEKIQPALAMNNTKEALTLMPPNEYKQESNMNMEVDGDNKYKGVALMRMVESMVGEELFEEVIKKFLNDNKNKVITPPMMYEMLYTAARSSKVDLAGKSVFQVMESWTNTPGYPTVSVTRNETHFLISQGSGNWHVPLSYALQSNTDKVQKVWVLPGENVSISASGNDWILVNINQTSFCRVNYSSELWPVISRQLKTDLTKIPPMMRSQLIGDMFSHWYDGYMLTDTLFDFMGFLDKEPTYPVWFTTLWNYNILVSKFKGFAAHSLLQKYILNLMTAAIAEVGMDPRPQDTHIVKLRRSLLLENACKFGHEGCLKKASSILSSWINQTSFDPDLNIDLLSAGISNSSTDVWWKVHSMYSTSAIPSVRAHILPALASSRDPQLLKEFITNITLRSTYNEKEKHVLLKTLSSTPSGSSALFNWLLDSLYSRLNRTRNETQGVTTDKPSSTESAATQGPDNTTSSAKMRSTTSSTRDLEEEESSEQAPDSIGHVSDSDVSLILHYLLPSLRSMDNGTMMEPLAKNDSGLPDTVIEVLRIAITQIYENDKWARSRNGEIQIWLEKTEDPHTSAAPPPGDGTETTTRPTPSSAPPLTTTLTLCLVSLAVLLRHLS